MGKNDNDKNNEEQGSGADEAGRKKEAWMNRNGPVLAVAAGVLLIALLSVAMKTCG